MFLTTNKQADRFEGQKLENKRSEICWTLRHGCPAGQWVRGVFP